MAIISVILLHSLPSPVQDLIGGPFHILQAVPVFLILLGYNGVNSFSRQEVVSFWDCYKLSIVKSRLGRIVWPFVVVFIIELLLATFTKKEEISLTQMILLFITGGLGPGSYFFPLMIQHIIIFPLMYNMAIKNLKMMMVLVFLVDMSFEVYAYVSGMPNSYYRLLYIRYLFAVALGVWLSKRKNNNNFGLISGAVLSLIYISAVHYFGFRLPVQPDWLSQNAPSFFWPLLLTFMGLFYLPKTASSLYIIIISEVGKASYHIFLVQMACFWYKGSSALVKGLPIQVFTPLNVIICISIGVLFYRADVMVRKILEK